MRAPRRIGQQELANGHEMKRDGSGDVEIVPEPGHQTEHPQRQQRFHAACRDDESNGWSLEQRGGRRARRLLLVGAGPVTEYGGDLLRKRVKSADRGDFLKKPSLH